MKIAITSKGIDFDSEVDTRFGRSKGFVIYNSETGKIEYIDNYQNLNAVQGAGIQAAKHIIDQKVDVLVTGNLGPKAYDLLKNSNIEILLGASGKVKDAIEDYENNKLNKAESANVEGHW